MTAISCQEFVDAAVDFLQISDRINDGWKLCKNDVDAHKSYLRKETFIQSHIADGKLLKTEYVIFYNQSYGVPSFSFNVWDSSGVLLTLEKIRKMSFLK